MKLLEVGGQHGLIADMISVPSPDIRNERDVHDGLSTPSGHPAHQICDEATP